MATRLILGSLPAVAAGFFVLSIADVGRAAWVMLLPFIAAILLAAGQPDPLSPVPHVEQVIRVSWRHSNVAGVGVSMAAIVLVVALAARLTRIEMPLAAVAAYYTLLYVCSIADLTPAPLIGYGAGPLLGYGLLAGSASLLDRSPAIALS